MDDNRIWIPAVIFAAFYVGWLLGSAVMKSDMQRQAVEYGYAEYDKVTGDWQWKILPEKTQD